MSSGSDHDVIAPDVAGRWRFRLGYLSIVVRVEFFGFVALISAGAVWIPIDAPSLEFRVLGWGMLAGLMVTLPVHEAGHWLTARSLGFWPQALVLRGLGVAVATDHSGMTRDQEDRVLLAGPVTDLGVRLLFGGLFALAWWLPVPQLVAIAFLGAPFGALVMLAMDLDPGAAERHGQGRSEPPPGAVSQSTVEMAGCRMNGDLTSDQLRLARQAVDTAAALERIGDVAAIPGEAPDALHHPQTEPRHRLGRDLVASHDGGVAGCVR